MDTTVNQMHKVLAEYFKAWQDQDSERLCSLFTEDGIYKVKPFGLEEYFGKDKIREYWEANPVARQKKPEPRMIRVAFGDNLCFAEWENEFKTLDGAKKKTRGMLLLEFTGGRINELREHYQSIET